MLRQICTILAAAVLFSCTKPDMQQRSANDIKSDSLKAAADSIAVMRNLSSMTPGAHIHNNGDLAAAAHQDPKRAGRIKKMQNEMRESRKEAARKRSEAVRMAIEKAKAEEQNAN